MPSYKIIDAHVHTVQPDTAPVYLKAMDEADTERAVMLSLPFPGLGTLNAAALATKAHAPDRLYAFVSLDYRGMTEPGWAAREIAALETCFAAGADGIKMLLGKGGSPMAHFPLNHPRLTPIYDWFARKGVPVICHIRDVPHFWWTSAINEWATSAELAGCYADYPHACPPPEVIKAQAEAVVAAHPGVRFIFPHIGMPATLDDIDWFASLLDRAPQVMTDLSGMCTVGWLAQDREKGRDFLETYADRAYYGTDAGFDGDPENEGNMRQSFVAHARNYQDFLETDRRLTGFYRHGYQGVALSDSALRKIYRDNFEARIGAPAPMEREALGSVLTEAIDTLNSLRASGDELGFGKHMIAGMALREKAFLETGTFADTWQETDTVAANVKRRWLAEFERLLAG